MQFPSRLIEEAVAEIAKLPGIGKKTAMRLALHLIKQDKSYTSALTLALDNLRNKITYCIECNNISDAEICQICQSHIRERSIICVVEDSRDVIALENTGQYRGLYHVLGGVISPMQGLGPEELSIKPLMERVEKGGIREVILALSPTMEGDTTSFYLYKKLKDFPLKISSLARGVPIGGELEYADELTLGRSIVTRTSVQFD